MLLEVDRDAMLPRHDADPVQSRPGRSRLSERTCRVRRPRTGAASAQSNVSTPMTRPMPPRNGMNDTCANMVRGVLHGVLVALGEVERVGDDHRLAAADDVGSHQRAVQPGHVIAVTQFRGKRAGVFEPDVVPVAQHRSSRRRRRRNRTGNRARQPVFRRPNRWPAARLRAAAVPEASCCQMRSRAAADNRAATRSTSSRERNGFGR